MRRQGVPRAEAASARGRPAGRWCGLPEFGGRRPDALSGGQRQRVALARALGAAPPAAAAGRAAVRAGPQPARANPAGAAARAGGKRAPPSCWSRMTRTRHWPSPPASAFCTRAGSPRSARPPTSTSVRAAGMWRSSWGPPTSCPPVCEQAGPDCRCCALDGIGPVPRPAGPAPWPTRRRGPRGAAPGAAADRAGHGGGPPTARRERCPTAPTAATPWTTRSGSPAVPPCWSSQPLADGAGALLPPGSAVVVSWAPDACVMLVE